MPCSASRSTSCCPATARRGRTGNQLLAVMFGAQMHYVGCPPNHWGELEIAREQLTDELAPAGAAPHSIPIGGSTATGAVGYLVGLRRARRAVPGAWRDPGGRRAHVVERRHPRRAASPGGRCCARSATTTCPAVLAIGVAKGVVAGVPDVRHLATEALALIGSDAAVRADDVEIDDRWLGPDYDVATRAGAEAIRWAAVHGGWVLDRDVHRQGLRRSARQRRRRPLGPRRRRRLHPHRRPAGRLRRRLIADSDDTDGRCVPRASSESGPLAFEQ